MDKKKDKKESKDIIPLIKSLNIAEHPEAKQMTFFEKLRAISLSIMNIEQNAHIQDYSKTKTLYRGTKEEDVLLPVKIYESYYRVYSVMVKCEIVQSDNVVTMDKEKQKLQFVDRIHAVLRIFDLDSDKFIDVESNATGLDSGDKGLGKASTYAQKDALQMAYKLIKGNDPDMQLSPELEPDIMSPKDEVINYYNSTPQKYKEICAYFHVGTIEDCTETQFMHMYSNLKKKKLI